MVIQNTAFNMCFISVNSLNPSNMHANKQLVIMHIIYVRFFQNNLSFLSHDPFLSFLLMAVFNVLNGTLLFPLCCCLDVV